MEKSGEINLQCVDKDFNFADVLKIRQNIQYPIKNVQCKSKGMNYLSVQGFILVTTSGGKMITRKKYDLEDRLIDFAVLVCKIANRLPSNRVSYHVVGQIIRSSTAPAANYGEAQAAESRKDFIHKMKLCLKELRETKVWIKFLRQMQLYDPEKIQNALNESNELIAIFAKSIQTAQSK